MKALTNYLVEKKSFKFNFKKYEKEMHHYLSDKMEFFSMKFNWEEDIESIHLIKQTDNEVIIEIHIPTGKGYGDTHYREEEYTFTIKNYGSASVYWHTRVLNDHDREAQLVRRFEKGFVEMTKDMERPEKLTFIIKQELD